MPKANSKHLYYKLFCIYSGIILVIVVVLMLFFIYVTRTRVLETQINYMKMMIEKSESYMKQCAKITDNIHNELYQSDEILSDLLSYFQYQEEDYLKYRLDRYMESPYLTYTGINDFTYNNLKSYSDILRIEFISYERGELTTFKSNGTNFRNKNIKKYLKQIEVGDLAKNNEFSFFKEIRDTKTMQSMGCMIIAFSTDQFIELQKFYGQLEILILNENNTVILNTYNKYNNKDMLTAKQNETLDKFTNSYMEKVNFKDYTINVFLDKQQVKSIANSPIYMIIGIGMLVIVIGELLIHWYLSRLTKRLNYILDGMKKVMIGDLDVRLLVNKKGDELDFISDNFNEMCEKLDLYIKKSYLAEIEQRNAEIEVLQNQINPHFLYNTLEAIRMKAIINGDREVGKMLYGMAVIFRSQIKEADIITVVQELHYCKKYLELFEFRYKGKFTSHVDCPEEVMNYPIIKFIIQPVIENYFMHGIRTEKEGNEISILVEEKNNILIIHIKDNGRGMPEDEMSEIYSAINKKTVRTKKSIGLANVNKRIKAIYGEAYGVQIKQNVPDGLHVMLKIGIKEGMFLNETSHVSGR